MLNFSRILFFAFVASVLLHEAFSLECYFCESYKGGECDRNPAQYKYRVNCDSSTASMISNIDFNATALGTENLAQTMDCMKITGRTRTGLETVARSCGIRQLSCDRYAEILWEKNGYDVQSCSRCYGNLCNASL